MKIKSLFKKAQLAVAASVTPQSVIEKIHGEFATAADIALAEAKEILSKSKDDYFAKGDRLAKLGFHSSVDAKNTSNARAEANTRGREMQAIIDCQQKYPLHKFILFRQATEICKKYGLVCGDVKFFKGFVPEKNLKEIEAFMASVSTGYKKRVWDVDRGEVWVMISEHEYTKTRDLARQNDDVKPYRRGIEGIMVYGGVGGLGQTSRHYSETPYMDSFRREYSEGSATLKICAPVKDFDTTRMRVNEDKHLVHVPDPVVLCEVEHGYLIVTAWGDEASDPLVVNERNN
jgi:hypothetical protein